MKAETLAYNEKFELIDREICDRLAITINGVLTDTENKIWHAHPVWFIDGNPIVGYSKEKKGIRLMFWSGTDFDTNGLIPTKGKFKDASVFYESLDEIDVPKVESWLEESKHIQWDYKNIVKRKGRLDRLV